MIRRLLAGRKGQATVEYLLVGVVLIMVAAGLGALWHAVSGEGMGGLIDSSASHDVGHLGGAVDVFMY